MASPELIAELLRQDQQNKLLSRQQPVQDMQTAMQAIFQGVQIYDMVKGLGAKFGSPGKTTTTPGTSVVPPLTQAGSAFGSQITPRLMGGALPPSAQAPGLDVGSLLRQNLNVQSAVSGGDVSAPPFPNVGGVPGQDFSSLLSQLPPTLGTPGTPAVTTVTPPKLGLYELERQKAEVEIPKIQAEIEKMKAEAERAKSGVYVQVGKNPDGTPIWMNLPGKVDTSAYRSEQKTKVEEEKIQAGKGKEDKKAQEKKDSEAKKTSVAAAKLAWNKGLALLSKDQEIPDSFMPSFIQAGKTLGEDVSQFEKPKTPGWAAQTFSWAKKKMGMGGGGNLVKFRDSEGGIHIIPEGNLPAARQRDPGLTILNE